MAYPLGKYAPVLLLVMMITGFWNTASAQKQKKQFITLLTGLTSYNEINKVVSPLHYSGVSVPLKLNYSKQTPDRLHRLKLSIISSRLENTLSRTRDILFVELGYSLTFVGKDVSFFGKELRLEGGVGLLNRGVKLAQYVSTPHIAVYRENDGYILSALTAHVHLQWQLNNNHHLAFTIESPLVQYRYHRSYSGVGFDHTFEGGWRNVVVISEWEYALRLSQEFDLLTNFSYYLNRFKEPNYYGVIQKTFGLGIRWRFQ